MAPDDNFKSKKNFQNPLGVSTLEALDLEFVRIYDTLVDCVLIVNFKQ